MDANNPRPLLPLKGNQGRASAPDAHVWLAASAGTGKTQVLAARVWRLLLHGAEPSAILCLTFTKAGAAEMAARITDRLAQWVRMDEIALSNDLAALGENPGPAMRDRARMLFAKVLDAPGGGLRIQTIHSFCQSLLAGFPMEAGLVPGFRPLEAREEAVLRREALAQMLVDAEREGRMGLVDAVGALSLRLGEGKAEAFLHECARAPDAMAALPTGIQPWLRAAFDLPLGDVAAEVERACGDATFDMASLQSLLAMNLSWKSSRAETKVEAIRRWVALDGPARAAGLNDLHRVWTDSKGQPGSFSKGWAPTDPNYVEVATRLHTRCADLIGMRDRAAYADLLAEALGAGREYADVYRRAKQRLGAVDFDDLIRATIGLLEQPGMGDWIRYKLDQATDHVLIDEAQDTNLAQWQIIDAIVSDFFAGAGAGTGLRTLFTVGDYKQAIFGFQGTDPMLFKAAQRRYAQRATQRSDIRDIRPLDFHDLSLTHSFRSTRPVLEFVDAALAKLPDPGMGALSDLEPHASEVAGPGTVTLWPLTVEGGSGEDEESWVRDTTRALATKIAKQIKSWVGTLPMRHEGRTLEPGDVMVLVKRRGELASLIVARLYAEGVPVAGIDRLRLNAPLAVQDLLAAVRFALQPDDDLSLASLLVSPLIGWTQDDLLAAAVRPSGSLWRHLRATQPDARLQPLGDLLARADFLTPYRFLEWILSGPLDGRRRMLARLGEEARDPVEELLNAALSFERLATPSLQRFLDWFDRGEVDVVRDAAQPQGAVRVMTAHGAKGLQAPLVILADAAADPTAARRDFTSWTPDEDVKSFPVFRPRGGEKGSPIDAAIAAADQRELEEHWRLFYVAATRAEEHLVLAGALGPRAKGQAPDNSWYAAAARALVALGVEAGEGDERRFHGAIPAARLPSRARETVAVAPEPTLPEWLHQPAPREARPPRPLAPSSLGEDEVADPPPSAVMRAAAERGRCLHALFERLPAVTGDRRAAADRWLEHGAGIADAATRAALIDAALAVIDDPRFADLFSADALAEAPIAAVVDGLVVSGTVDRLLVLPDRVRVVDFKTGRRVPGTGAEIPRYHLRQMAAYVDALKVVFPGRPVEAGLLYTAGPKLFVLPESLLEANKPVAV